uniref:GRIP domain-containing protein n=1 Tax=Ciona savignyi TaxID=51511 RepID=H2ZPI8_CIOSA
QLEEVGRLKKELTQKNNEVNILRKSVENLREQVASSTYEAELMKEKLASSEKSQSDRSAESEAFQETNAQLSIMLKEREYEAEILREKVSTLNDFLQQNEQGKDNDTKRLIGELDRANEQATTARHERDQIMLTLKQRQMESQRANDDVRLLRDKEAKLQSELMRLRDHLVQVEETYTQEALLSEEREQDLRTRLEQTHTRGLASREENQQWKQQIESLHEQLRVMMTHRDQAVQKCQLLQEQSTQYATALHQLQSAAERMQREEQATYIARADKIEQQLKSKQLECEQLAAQVTNYKSKLDEASEALVSASRLNDQLEIKETTIEQLKSLVSEKQLQLEEALDNLHSIRSVNENMVDKQLVKNLLIGYFTSATTKQPDVMRLITSVIGFSKEEEERLHPKKSWGGWLSWGRGNPQPEHAEPPANLNESFSQMFVKFLETESTSMKPGKLPTNQMVN